MHPWLVLAALAVIAVLYVMIPVGLSMAAAYRRQKLVRCPHALTDAAIMISGAGWAEVLGLRSMRTVAGCSRWPEHRGCDQACLGVRDEAIRDFRPAV